MTQLHFLFNKIIALRLIAIKYKVKLASSKSVLTKPLCFDGLSNGAKWLRSKF